jgi:hypothetical protein
MCGTLWVIARCCCDSAAAAAEVLAYGDHIMAGSQMTGCRWYAAAAMRHAEVNGTSKEKAWCAAAAAAASVATAGAMYAEFAPIQSIWHCCWCRISYCRNATHKLLNLSCLATADISITTAPPLIITCSTVGIMQRAAAVIYAVGAAAVCKASASLLIAMARSRMLRPHQQTPDKLETFILSTHLFQSKHATP